MAGREAFVKGVGRGSREQVVDLDARMMSEMVVEVTGAKLVRGEREGKSVGGGSGWVGVGELQMAAVRELLIAVILFLKKFKNELHRSGEEVVFVAGG